MTEQGQPTEQRASLYVRLGGYDAIYKFAAAALKKGLAHPTIGHVSRRIGSNVKAAYVFQGVGHY